MNNNSISLHPFTYIVPSVGFSAFFMCALLMVQLLMLFLTGSFQSVIIFFAAVCASLCAEGIYHFLRKSFFESWIIALVQGAMAGLLLPSSYPVAGAFFVVLCTFLLGKYAFGGFSRSWINPVALCVVAAYFLNSSAFPGFLISRQDLLSRNPAHFLIQSGSVPLVHADHSVTAFLNRTVFKIFGIVIPDGYVSLFWDTGSVIPAFRFNLITLLSSILLVSLGIVEAVVPLLFVAVYLSLVHVFGPALAGGAFFQGDMLLALLTGGTLFGTLFLLQWYGTTPATRWGKAVYGIIAGIAAFFVMGAGTSPVGYAYCVLLMNLFCTMIQTLEDRQVRRRVEGVLLPRLRLLQEVENA